MLPVTDNIPLRIVATLNAKSSGKGVSSYIQPIYIGLTIALGA